MTWVLAKRKGRIYHPLLPFTDKRRGLCGEGWTSEYGLLDESDVKKRGMRLCKNCERKTQ